jgi:hypothetical protein
MRLFLCTSKHCYDRLEPIRSALVALGHEVTMPNSYDEPFKEDEVKGLGPEEHRKWKAAMIQDQAVKIGSNDAILVVNLEKYGQENYIGGATFLEMFKAFELGKTIYLYNPIPEVSYKDEILAFAPILIQQDLSNI